MSQSGHYMSQSSHYKMSQCIESLVEIRKYHAQLSFIKDLEYQPILNRIQLPN